MTATIIINTCTVREEFVDIDEDELFTLSQDETGDYYTNAHEFFTEVADRDIDSLTEGQINWLSKIQDDLLAQS